MRKHRPTHAHTTSYHNPTHLYKGCAPLFLFLFLLLLFATYGLVVSELYYTKLGDATGV